MLKTHPSCRTYVKMKNASHRLPKLLQTRTKRILDWKRFQNL